MPAAKHALGAEGESAAPPSKKTKVDDDAQLKTETKEGKSKKKDKKNKKPKADAEDAGQTPDADTARSIEKEHKKERKLARKESRQKLKEAGEGQQREKEQAQEEEDKEQAQVEEEKEAPAAKDKEESSSADKGKDKKKAKKTKKTKDKEQAQVEEAEEAPIAKEKEEESSADKGEDKKKAKKTKKSKDKKETKTQPDGGREYVQTMSLSSVPQADIDAFLATHEITVTDPRSSTTTGAALRPVTGFEHLPSTNLLEKQPSPFAGFKTPTPIQAGSWPFTLSGRDVVGVAETGSGKTMAFALPCVEAVCAAAAAEAEASSSKTKTRTTRAVVVSPTRELAMQTHEQMARLAALVGLRCVCLYGGASKDDQRALLQRGCELVVATPGRLKDFMADGTVDLGGARFVVLDEADRMLDKGFEDDIRHMLGCCPPREARQTLMFTATWPQSVQALASTLMVDPVKVTIGSGRDDDGDGAVELQANARIAQAVEVVDPRDKEGRLLQILKQRQQGKHRMDRILVFCLYKKEATRIEALLSRRGISVTGIHGDLRQEQRTRSLEAFKSGTTPVLVATDVAARGLDIPEVKLVINVTVRLARAG